MSNRFIPALVAVTMMAAGGAAFAASPTTPATKAEVAKECAAHKNDKTAYENCLKEKTAKTGSSSSM